MQQSINVTSGQANLSVDVAGSGPLVVFLHANVCDKRMWGRQMSALRENYKTVAFDRRGFGQSNYVAEPHSPMADLFAVMDAVDKNQSAVLVACSAGGKIAIDAAIEHPARIKALVLISPSVSGAPVPQYASSIMHLLDDQAAATRERKLDRLNAIKAHLWLDGPLANEGRVTGQVRELFLKMNGEALAAPFPGDSIDTTLMYGRLSEIKVPVLLVWGSLDFQHIQFRTKAMIGMVKSGSGLEMAGSAHLPSLEHPSDFNKLLIEFLANIFPLPS